MDEAIKQEILLQTDEQGLRVSIRVHALEQAVKWLAPAPTGMTSSGKDVINVAKKFEAYLRSGE